MRPARALIDLQALRHNYRLARELTGAKAPGRDQADAYGHGAVRCALALEAEADGFAVACIEEALELRGAGIKARCCCWKAFSKPASWHDRRARSVVWCTRCGSWRLSRKRNCASR